MTDIKIDPSDLLNDDGEIDTRGIAARQSYKGEKVSADECAELRRQALSGMSTGQLKRRSGRPKTTIRTHITGEGCGNHGDVDEPALRFDREQDQWVPAEEVSDDD